MTNPVPVSAANASSLGAAEILPRFVSEWEALRGQPPTAARDNVAAEWLNRLAATAPEQAMALALAEPHAARRRHWRDAVLRGWSAAAPEDAVAWVMRQLRDKNEATDIAAIFAGVAARPELALALAERFTLAFPSRGADHGSLLISAFADAGQFTAAAAYALRAGAEQREAWTAAAFSRWSEAQPQAATNAALALTDPALRDVAWRAAVAHWAQNEPPSLADYALRLPEGESRTYALGEALRLWIESDPSKAARWLDQLDPNRDTDLAVSLIATHPALTLGRPEVALSWAESIAEPTARSRAVARVVKVWADADPAAAQGYARTAPALLAEDREDLLPGEHFAPHP